MFRIFTIVAALLTGITLLVSATNTYAGHAIHPVQPVSATDRDLPR